MNGRENESLRVDVENGKYTYIIKKDPHRVCCERYGAPWRTAFDVVGQNMIMAMAYELDAARERIKEFDGSCTI